MGALILALLLLCGLHTVTLAFIASDVVTVSQGKVQGQTVQLTEQNNAIVDIFRGLPFAQPPIGPLRLKKPEPALPWTGIRNATTDETMCIQPSHKISPTESEDCLYLDVFRPKLDNISQPLPVMVWIHGGGFMSNSKNEGAVSGQYLAAMGVITVFINYRLGPLGFLTTEDDSMPGNFGSMDQIAALKWVQTNIGAFGGDPGSVTIFGESAGSASVSLLLYSPLAKGLFVRAIMESGVSITPWDVSPPNLPVSPKEVALATGKDLGCTQSPGPDFLACLQKTEVKTFYNASITAGKSDHTFGPFRPRVETSFGFLPDYPLRLLSRGEFIRASTIRGFNAQELGARIQDNDNNGLTQAEFHNYARATLVNFPYLDKDTYIKLLEDVYLENVTDPFEIRSEAIAMLSDFMYILPIVTETQKSRWRNTGFNSFLYKFNYKPSFTHSPAWRGVLHAQNKVFVFGLHPKNQYTPADLKISSMLMSMWVNFAKFDDPTPNNKTDNSLVNWQQFFTHRPTYLEIAEQPQLKTFDTDKEKRKLSLFERTIQDYLLAIDNVDIVG